MAHTFSFSVFKRTLFLFSALLILLLVFPHSSSAVAPDRLYKVMIVNNTGVDSSKVFVTLTSGGATPSSSAGVNFGQAYPLSGGSTPWTSEGNNKYSVVLDGTWVSGTILYSFSRTDPSFAGYTSQPTVGTNDASYGFSELTFDATNTFNGDLSAVTQIGVPARLTVLDPNNNVSLRNGQSIEATEYIGCPFSTAAAMNEYAPSWNVLSSPVWRTYSDGSFLSLAAPADGMYTEYPSFEQYLESLAGQTLTVRGYFGGGGASGLPGYYDYSGVVGSDGSVRLAGTIYDDAAATTTTHYSSPQGLYVPASEMYGNTADWYGTGYGVYAQNGPYTVEDPSSASLSGGVWSGSATVPPEKQTDYVNPGDPTWTAGTQGAYLAVGNDIYGWIYGDLVTSLAMGYFGSDATGSPVWDSNLWNTNAPVDPTTHPAGFTWWTSSGLPAYESAWSTQAAFARYNVYQAATSVTGTTYGMSLGDRFAPAGSVSPELGVTNTPNSDGFYGTWQVELLSNDGCAQLYSASSSSGPASGGSEVVLTGANIRPGAKVFFGDSQAEVLAVDYDYVSTANTVTVRTPPGSGVVDVKVFNTYSSPAASSQDWCVLEKAYSYDAVANPTPPSSGPGKAKRLVKGVFVYPDADPSSIRQVSWKRTWAAKKGKYPLVKVDRDQLVVLSGIPGLSKYDLFVSHPDKAKRFVKVPANVTSGRFETKVLKFTQVKRFVFKAKHKKDVRFAALKVKK